MKFPVFSQLAGNFGFQRRVRSRLPPPAESPCLPSEYGGLSLAYTATLEGWITCASTPRASSQRASQKPARPASKASAIRVSQQRCMPCWSAAFLRPKQLATTVERDPAADHHRLAVSFSAGPMVRIRFPPAESRANFISPTGPRDLGQRQGRRGRSAHGRRGYL